MTLALEGGEWSASRPGRTLPPGKSRYPLYRRLGGPQDRSGQVRKISPPTEIRSPDRPARSRSLYWLSYPAYKYIVIGQVILLENKVRLDTINIDNQSISCYSDVQLSEYVWSDK
jgi:hypothetical protein